MQTIEEVDSLVSCATRRILVAVDDTRACEGSLEWTLKEFCRSGDEVHLLNVVPQAQPASAYGAPPVDSLPQDPAHCELMAKQAERFINERFLPKLEGTGLKSVVHIVKGVRDADSIGNVICMKAQELGVVAVVIASQGKSKFQQFFLGSTSAYVSKACKVPVLIIH